MLARRLWRDGHARQPGLEASDRLLDGTLQAQPGVDVRGRFVAEVREAERRDRARRILASQEVLVDPGESGRQQPFQIAPHRLEDACGRLPGPGRGIVLPELGLVVQQAIQHRFPDRLVCCGLAGHGGRGRASSYCFFGTSETRRRDMVSSSNWKCGRRKKTALYEPGRALFSVTSTRASRSGNFAFWSWVALSSSRTYWEIQVVR